MRLLIAAVACWGLGCAGVTANAPAPDFRPSDAALFGNAVDTVGNPAIVEGEWGGAFERRVGRADLIAEVRVQSLSSELIKRSSAYRLDVRVKDRLKGSSARELSFRVSDDEPGYRSVQVNEDRLLQDPFIAFVKWEADEATSERIAHWHLSPDTEAVRDKIEYLLRNPAPEPHTTLEVVEP